MTNVATIAVSFEVDPDLVDMFVAELADIGFEGFEERDGGLVAFVPSDRYESARAATEPIAQRLGARWTGTHEILPENWNARWEATVTPIVAGGFCVHPPWSPPEPGTVPVCIEPKMSFGTGHHETTRLMLGVVDRFVSEGTSVLDAGTGTGVLAIAALLRGAGSACGFDVEAWAVDNAAENAGRNGVSERLEVRLGGIEVAPDRAFDLVLANINRNVLIEMLPALAARMGQGAHLALAGFLTGDRSTMVSALANHGLVPVEETAEGDWMALVARKA